MTDMMMMMMMLMIILLNNSGNITDSESNGIECSPKLICSNVCADNIVLDWLNWISIRDRSKGFCPSQTRPDWPWTPPEPLCGRYEMMYPERYDNRIMTLNTDHLFNYTLKFASTPSYACTLWPLITPSDTFTFICNFILSNLFVKAILMGSPSVSLPVQPSLWCQ